MDCRTPTEATLLSPKPLRTTELSDYREMVITLSSARALAMKYSLKSQRQYKEQYDKKATTIKFYVGDLYYYTFHKM